MMRCPHVIMVAEHYRDDGSCKCNDPNEKVMREWGYRWKDGSMEMSIYAVRLTPEEQRDFDPAQFLTKMKAAGFKFDSEACPVKIAQPWGRIIEPDGTAVYWQRRAQ